MGVGAGPVAAWGGWACRRPCFSPCAYSWSLCADRTWNHWEAWRSEGMRGLLSGALRWVSEGGGRALLQVARWAQGIPGGGGQVRQGAQLPGGEIPTGLGTCNLLGKKEREVKTGRDE